MAAREGERACTHPMGPGAGFAAATASAQDHPNRLEQTGGQPFRKRMDTAHYGRDAISA